MSDKTFGFVKCSYCGLPSNFGVCKNEQCYINQPERASEMIKNMIKKQEQPEPTIPVSELREYLQREASKAIAPTTEQELTKYKARVDFCMLLLSKFCGGK